MKKINISMLLLAMLVISMFIGVGVAIAFRSIWFIALFTVLGFVIMSYGISLKRKNSAH
ncbi:DUF5325 family protein [Ornithinibacillus sp. 4-3]|uniref:DUF5325 family protein n=1 Tax=Ornithinibacillus sp. 4-3 TaxID=3231488 RepID=A0AB39HTR4_9BACI